MVFHKTLARGLGFLMVLAGCGTSTGLKLVTDGDVLLSGLSDEFNDPGSISISTWLVRAEVEAEPVNDNGTLYGIN